MVNPENPAFALPWARFEANPTYKNLDRAPKTVVTQTDSIIELSNAGILSPGLTYNYLSTYTIPFLRSAAQGIGRVYSQDGATINTLSVEVNEAADFTNVVFSWMHYFARSQFLPNGFARRGVLRAPQTSKEFMGRLKEIKFQLSVVASGQKISGISFMANPQAFRTYTFFKVGSLIPLRFMESDRERKEHESGILEKLLEGIDTSLSGNGI